jgi:hypothetical protein
MRVDFVDWALYAFIAVLLVLAAFGGVLYRLVS